MAQRRRAPKKKEPPRRNPIIPRPPESKTMVDYVVLIFVTTLAFMLISMIAGIFILAVFGSGSTNLGPAINAVTDIMNTILGALIGFVAGKGAGRTEAEEAARSTQEEPGLQAGSQSKQLQIEAGNRDDMA